MWRSGYCFCGRALLTKASVQLSTDGWGCTPSLLVVWPEVTRPWGDWGLCGRVNDELPSGFMLRGRVLPCHSCCEPLPTHAFSGVFAALAGGFGSVSCGVTAPFLWVLLHSRFCILQDWSLWLPQSCGSLFFFFYQIPLALKIRFPGNSQSFRQVPGWAAWCGVQNLHNSGRTFGIIAVQFVGHPPGGMVFEFTIYVPLLLSHCNFFVFGHWVSFFGGFQCPSVHVVKQFNVILLLLQEEMSALASAPSSWTISPVVCFQSESLTPSALFIFKIVLTELTWDYIWILWLMLLYKNVGILIGIALILQVDIF